MDRIYREYPETKKAREDYRKEVLRHKGELSDRERALDDLKGEIDVIKSRMAGVAVATEESILPSAGVSSGTSVAPLLGNSETEPSLGSTSSGGESSEQSPTSTEPALSTGTNVPPGTNVPKTPDMFALPKGALDKDITPEELAKREALLLKRQAELEEAKASSTQALKKLESDMSKKILGRLYKALVDLAQEKGIRLVVDKSAILYGQDTIDLTEDLHRRVRGLPAEGN
jgi:Skp family chaperone for outer membrane proteins